MTQKWNSKLLVLLISHSFFWLATNLISPFLSIFLLSTIPGMTLSEVGIASMIFFLAFGLLEPLMGALSDRLTGLKDDVFLLIFGYLLRGGLFILFAFATTTWHIYMFQLFLGLARAIASPSDKVLFAHYLGKGKHATMWGADESLVNLSAAIGAGFGGYFITVYGFQNLLVITGILTVIAGCCNFLLISRLKRRQR